MAETECTFCGKPVQTSSAYRKVTGWEQKRGTGGTNALRLREPKDEWACDACVSARASGREGQGSLI